MKDDSVFHFKKVSWLGEPGRGGGMEVEHIGRVCTSHPAAPGSIPLSVDKKAKFKPLKFTFTPDASQALGYQSYF